MHDELVLAATFYQVRNTFTSSHRVARCQTQHNTDFYFARITGVISGDLPSSFTIPCEYHTDSIDARKSKMADFLNEQGLSGGKVRVTEKVEGFNKLKTLKQTERGA